MPYIPFNTYSHLDTRPIWIFEHIENNLRRGNGLAVLIPCLTTQEAVRQDGHIVAIADGDHAMYEVGKQGYISFPRDDHGPRQLYLASVIYIRLHNDLRHLRKITGRMAGFKTATQCLAAYAAHFGNDALDAFAWEIGFRRTHLHPQTAAGQERRRQAQSNLRDKE